MGLDRGQSVVRWTRLEGCLIDKNEIDAYSIEARPAVSKFEFTPNIMKTKVECDQARPNEQKGWLCKGVCAIVTSRTHIDTRTLLL